MLRGTSYWDDWREKEIETFFPVILDGKYIGDVQVACSGTEQSKREKNLIYAQEAVDEILPKYNPKTIIHELSISIELPMEDRIKAVVSAVATSMKIDELLRQELLNSYLESYKGR